MRILGLLTAATILATTTTAFADGNQAPVGPVVDKFVMDMKKIFEQVSNDVASDTYFDRSDRRAADESYQQFLKSGAMVLKDQASTQQGKAGSGAHTAKGVGVNVTIYGFDKPLSPSELKRFSGAETGLALRNEYIGKIVTAGVSIATNGLDASGAPRGTELSVYEEMSAIDGLVSKPDGSEPERMTSPYRSGLTFTTKGLHLGTNDATLEGGVITISALNSLETFEIGGDAALQSVGTESKVIQGDWTIPYGRRIAFEIAAPKSAGSAKRKFEVITLEVSYPFDVTE